MTRRMTIAAAAWLAVSLSATAGAHIPALRGRLVELTAASDLILIGTIKQVRPVDTRHFDVTIAVERVLAGRTDEAALVFHGTTRFATGSRQVVFLRRSGTDLVGAQASGTVFPAAPPDDAAYAGAIASVRDALRAPGTQRAALLWQGLVPALTAHPAALRYHAALELAALADAGHPPSDGMRAQLRSLAATPDTDPDLRPLLADLAATR
jgi:hypothetical protein